MGLSSTLAFAAIALVMIVIPRPSVLFIVSRAVSLGRQAALGTVLGNALGEFLQVLVVAVGLGQLLERSALAFTVIKLVGAAYLCYLGVVAWRGKGARALELAAAAPARSRLRIVLDGIAVGLTNPKSMVFFAAVLPDFVRRSLGDPGLQQLLLGVVWVAVALISDGAWALTARRPGSGCSDGHDDCSGRREPAPW